MTRENALARFPPPLSQVVLAGGCLVAGALALAGARLPASFLGGASGETGAARALAAAVWPRVVWMTPVTYLRARGRGRRG